MRDLTPMEDNREQRFYCEEGATIFETAEEREKSERQQREEEQHSFNRSQVRLATGNLITQVLLVLFSLIGLGASLYSAWQAKASANAATRAADTARLTLEEMRHGSGALDTHTLATEAVDQAKQTTVLAKAAQEQARALEETARRQATQAAATNRLAAAAQVSATQGSTQLLLQQRQIETSQRPWISVVANADGLYLLDHRNAMIQTTVKLTNVGHSVARNLLITPRLLMNEHWTGNDCELNPPALEDLKKNFERGLGSVIFPGQLMTASRPAFTKPTNPISMSSDGADLFELVTCVWYRSTLDDVIHHTEMVQLVLHKGSNNGGFHSDPRPQSVDLMMDVNGEGAN